MKKLNCPSSQFLKNKGKITPSQSIDIIVICDNWPTFLNNDILDYMTNFQTNYSIAITFPRCHACKIIFKDETKLQRRVLFYVTRHGLICLHRVIRAPLLGSQQSRWRISQ